MVWLRKRHKVLVLFDTDSTPPADQDFTKELKTDDWAAEAHVIEALKKLGHEVRTIGVWDEPGMIIDEIKAPTGQRSTTLPLYGSSSDCPGGVPTTVAAPRSRSMIW